MTAAPLRARSRKSLRLARTGAILKPGWEAASGLGRVTLRVAFVVVGGLAIGGGAAALVPSEQASQAARALGFTLANFNLADINPIHAIYDRVMKDAVTPSTPQSLGFAPTKVDARFCDLKPIEWQGLNGGGFKLDPARQPSRDCSPTANAGSRDPFGPAAAPARDPFSSR